MYILVFTKNSQILSIILSMVGKRTDYLMLDQLQSKKNIKLMQLRSPYSFFRTRILGIIQKISKFGADSQVWCPVSIKEINKKSIIVVKNSSENKARRIFRKTNISYPLIRTHMYVCTSGGKKCSFYLWFYGVFRGYIM